MNSHATVSVVIPTIGRPSLAGAVDSALAQSIDVFEIVVVADTTEPLALPDDDRIRVVRTGPGSGGANARQCGIQHATGDIIALLDDDDLWHPYKLERQLAEVSGADSGRWVVTCKCAVREPGHREKIWPRTLIGEHQSVADYLFTLRRFTLGDAMLQSSTLCFPRELAFQVPLNYAGVHPRRTGLADRTPTHGAGLDHQACARMLLDLQRQRELRVSTVGGRVREVHRMGSRTPSWRDRACSRRLLPVQRRHRGGVGTIARRNPQIGGQRLLRRQARTARDGLRRGEVRQNCHTTSEGPCPLTPP